MVDTLIEIIDRVDGALTPPDPAALAAALATPASRAEHDRFARAIAALSTVEYREPPAPVVEKAPLRVVAWNAERLKYGPASAAMLQPLAPDVVLLSETDLGMARSGNRHTTADLAAALGMGYVYGVEFVELSLGDQREQQWHRNERNAVGFHGNAILSRLPLTDIALIRLDTGGRWFAGRAGEQRRIGGRMAIAARIAAGVGMNGSSADLIAVSLHLESDSDAQDRAQQMTRLLAALNARYGQARMVIGGDCNTAELPRCADPRAWADRCEAYEPLFDVMAGAGFSWRDANDMAPSQRQRPDGMPLPPFNRIDWLFTRDLTAAAPRTIAAIDAAGSAISDHEALVVDLAVG